MHKILDNNHEVVASVTTANGNGVVKPLEQSITEAIELARAVCQTKGNTSSDCAVAWDVVQELMQAQNPQCYGKKSKSSLQQYCKQHPEAV